MRVQPRPLITVGLAIGYMVIVAITWVVVGLDYETVGDSTSNIIKGIVLPVALASASSPPSPAISVGGARRSTRSCLHHDGSGPFRC